MQPADRPAGSRTSLAGGLIALTGAVLPPLMIFVPRAPTVVMIVGAVGGAMLLARRGIWPAHPPRTLVWLLGGAILWAAVSAWWAVDPALALRGAAKLAGSVTVGLLLIGVAGRSAAGSGRWLAIGLLAGLSLTAVFLAVEALFGAPLSWLLWRPFEGVGPYDVQIRNYGPFWLNAATAVVVLMVWPLILCLPRLPLPGAVAIIVVAGAVSAGLSFEAGASALAAAGVAALLVGKYGSRAGRVLAVLAMVAVLVSPVLPRTLLDPDAMSRMEETVPLRIMPRFHIWAFAAERIAEKPAMGWGMNAARVIPGGHQRIYDETRGQLMGEIMPLHPHNAALQIWLELGLPGALLAAGLLGWVLRCSASLGGGTGGRAAAAATGLCVAATTLSSLSYGIWQSWWLAAIFLASALITAAAATAAKRS